jgi:hypothetical protein
MCAFDGLDDRFRAELIGQRTGRFVHHSPELVRPLRRSPQPSLQKRRDVTSPVASGGDIDHLDPRPVHRSKGTPLFVRVLVVERVHNADVFGDRSIDRPVVRPCGFQAKATLQLAVVSRCHLTEELGNRVHEGLVVVLVLVLQLGERDDNVDRQVARRGCLLFIDRHVEVLGTDSALVLCHAEQTRQRVEGCRLAGAVGTHHDREVGIKLDCDGVGSKAPEARERHRLDVHR